MAQGDAPTWSRSASGNSTATCTSTVWTPAVGHLRYPPDVMQAVCEEFEPAGVLTVHDSGRNGRPSSLGAVARSEDPPGRAKYPICAVNVLAFELDRETAGNEQGVASRSVAGAPWWCDIAPLNTQSSVAL
jgi:hypothetical protein